MVQLMIDAFLRLAKALAMILLYRVDQIMGSMA